MTFLAIPCHEGKETASSEPHQSVLNLVHEGEEIKAMKCESARLIKQSKKRITISTSWYSSAPIKPERLIPAAVTILINRKLVGSEVLCNAVPKLRGVKEYFAGAENGYV